MATLTGEGLHGMGDLCLIVRDEGFRDGLPAMGGHGSTHRRAAEVDPVEGNDEVGLADDLALMEALRTTAFYVGALGSRHNNAQRRKRLLEFDVSEAEAAQLRGPVGLNLGALTPPEIAMSIVAEMTAMRRGVDLSQALSSWESSKTVCGLA